MRGMGFELREDGRAHSVRYAGCVSSNSNPTFDFHGSHVRSSRKMRGMGFEPEQDDLARSLRSLASCDLQGSNPTVDSWRSRTCSRQQCEGWDSNPWTPTGADLKSTAVGLAWLPSRVLCFCGTPDVNFDCPRASRGERAVGPSDHRKRGPFWSRFCQRARDWRASAAKGASLPPLAGLCLPRAVVSYHPHSK